MLKKARPSTSQRRINGIEHAVLVARSGKHAFVEKPMALSLDDSDEIIAAFERSSTALVVHPTHSFGPAIRLMRELIDGGEVGRL